MSGDAYRVDGKSKNGCFIKSSLLFALILLVCATVVGVALIVHFTAEKNRNCIQPETDNNQDKDRPRVTPAPGEDSTAVPTDEPDLPTWQQCEDLADKLGKSARCSMTQDAEWKGNSVDDRRADSKSGHYRYGSVSCSDAQCSRIGTEILAKGGSAVDAAIAAGLCIGVINGQYSGIGGGAFITIYDKMSRNKTIIMAREVAPSAANKTMFVNTTDASTVGGLAVAVPGELKGYEAAHKKFGKLSWAQLFAPAIKLAREGFHVSWILHLALKLRENIIKSTPSLRGVYLKSDGSMYEIGDTIKRTRFANTLETVANHGADAFYTGSLSQDIVDDIQEYGGIVTKADLANYTADFVEPVTAVLKNGNYEIISPPPPSSGVIVQLILKILDGYMMKGDNLETKDDRLLTYHRIVEAFKFAYAKRSELGDNNKVNITELMNRIRSDSFAEGRRNKIDDSRTFPMSYYEPSFENVNDGGTSHISVLDQEGNACSITSTVNLLFGSKRIGTRTGIVFNNQMDDFSTPGSTNSFGFPASPSNFIEPGKRPMSSMSPSIILHRSTGDVAMVVGGTGGSKIISAIANTIIHSLWLNMTVTDAVDALRLHHQLSGKLTYEEEFEQYVIDGLVDKGHEIKKQLFSTSLPGLGAVHVIRSLCESTGLGYLQGCIEAVADWRKGGVPDGL